MSAPVILSQATGDGELFALDDPRLSASVEPETLPHEVHVERMAREYTAAVLEAMLGFATRDGRSEGWLSRLRDALSVAEAREARKGRVVSRSEDDYSSGDTIDFDHQRWVIVDIEVSVYRFTENRRKTVLVLRAEQGGFTTRAPLPVGYPEHWPVTAGRRIFPEPD